MGRLEGRSTVVTGAASGIGRATSRLFAREGASVLCVDRAPEAEATATAIREAGVARWRCRRTPAARPTSKALSTAR